MRDEILGALTPEQWVGEITRLLDAKPFKFRLACPCRLSATTRYGATTLHSYIGEEALDLQSAELDASIVGWRLCFADYSDGSTIWVGPNNALDIFDSSLKDVLLQAINSFESREHLGASLERERAESEAQASDALTINKENPNWGSW